MDLIGKRIGRYRIEKELGHGGMATVYHAFDTTLERDVAIKFIRRSAFGSEVWERMLNRFQREVKTLAKLDDAHIVKLYDYGDHDGSPFLVMQYISGGTLKERLGKPMKYWEAAHMLLPIARALAHAHEENIIHRDVKPANILITKKGELMLSDFGIAKIMEFEEGNTLTGTGVGVGTAEYMAPEQWKGKAVPQSDIYSLGVVLYELVTGQKPFTGDTPVDVQIKHLTEPLPLPRILVKDLPLEVEQVILKALEKKADARYTSMQYFADELAKLEKIKESGVHAEPSVVKKNEIRPQAIERTVYELPDIDKGSEKVHASLPETTDTPPVATSQPGRKKERSWLWIGAGILLVGIVAVIGILSQRMANSRSFAPALTLQQSPTTKVFSSVTADRATVQPTIEPSSTDTIWPTSTAKPTNTLTASSTITSTSPYKIGSTMVSPKDGMVLMYVPAGKFLMGSDPKTDSQALPDELPQHPVYLDAFWIDRTEVTYSMYKRCVNEGVCSKNTYQYTRSFQFSTSIQPTVHIIWGSSNASQAYDNDPIKVNWDNARIYCEWVGRRLLTEAEWEKAARGTDGRIYPWGNDLSCDKANYHSCNYSYTPVDNYPLGVSPFGVYDMAGNVFEWVNDWYSPGYYSQSPSDHPTGPNTGGVHVARGGGYLYDVVYIRSAARYGQDNFSESGYQKYPDGTTSTWTITHDSAGFRCASNTPTSIPTP
jgi:eukaryotic-like serine/threonine-protein kinase